MRQREKNRKSLLAEAFSWTLYIIVILVVTFLVVQFVGQRTTVNGVSMYPTLNDGDSLIVDKITYRFSNPKRFDVVVFPFQYQEGTYYIKRVVGLPGETVQIVEGVVYINGQPLEEEHGWGMIEKAGLASEPVTLGEDEYFVLGDNRNNSSDSREPSVGNVRKNNIIGRAVVRIWPVSEISLVK